MSTPFTPTYPGGLEIITQGFQDYEEYRVVMKKNGAFVAKTTSVVDADMIVNAAETATELARVREVNAELLSALKLCLNATRLELVEEAARAALAKHKAHGGAA